ncbi:hypothetical protein ON010_g15592 [Phytophthora cinnamomi]|nr:hypothetical protein ON010_g15592 [Phytophthora cinnamomi]
MSGADLASTSGPSFEFAGMRAPASEVQSEDLRLRALLHDGPEEVRDPVGILLPLEQGGGQGMPRGDDYDAPPPKRGFRADNAPQGRFHPKRSGRAYVVQDEDASDNEDDRKVRIQDTVEEVSTTPSTASLAVGRALTGGDSRKDEDHAQDISSAVFRVMENSGWRPPGGDFRAAPRSPCFENRNHANVTAAAEKRTPPACAEFDPAYSVRSFMKTHVKNGRIPSRDDTRSSRSTEPAAFNLTSPLDGDPERVGLKTTTDLCVLVYIRPELRSKNQDSHQCLTVISEEMTSINPINSTWNNLVRKRTAQKTMLWMIRKRRPVGESAVVRIDYGQSNPQRDVVRADRGDRWVTQIIYAARS